MKANAQHIKGFKKTSPGVDDEKVFKTFCWN